MEKENKRIKQNKNNRRLHVNRMYLKLFGILFILILLPLVSSVTYGDVNSIYSDFTWVDYDDANVEINYGGIDFTYGDSNNIVGYIRPTISSGLNSSLLFGVGSSSSISTILSLIGSTGRVGIGTTTPQNALNVIGDGNFTGNLYSNYSYSKNQVAQFHREAIATAGAINTWYNITFDLVIDDETIGEWYELTDSNSSVTINDFEGIIRIQGCIHPYNDNVGNQEATIYARVLVNGIEPRCLQRASSKDFKASGMDTLDVVGTVLVEDGDVITYQWRTTNTNLQLEGDSVFDNPVSASLNFERISDLK